MKRTNWILTGLFVILTLVGCKDGMGLLEEAHTTYVMEDGQKLEVGKIELDDGREYYLAAIDSVTYQQAVNLQKEGWVLPRMHGVFPLDEHRYSKSWIKMEELLGFPLCRPDTTLSDRDMEFCVPNPKFKIGGIESHLRSGVYIHTLWTDTRFRKNDGYVNYAISHSHSKDNENEELYSTFISDPSPMVRYGAILLKDAYLVENNIPDSIYVFSGNKKQVSGRRIHGADGYDYWTVMPVADSMMTWDKAMEYEKDGWMMARTEGKRYGIDARNRYRQWEWETIHSDGFHLTVEGLCGRHPLGTEFGIADNIKDAMTPFEYVTISWDCAGYWLSTPIGRQEAGTILSRKNVMLTSHDKELPLCRVALFKRIQPSVEDIKYRYILPNGNYAQARRVVGKSGSVYYVVDPSGWQGLKYSVAELPGLEKDGYHVIRLDELSDMLGVQLNERSKIPNFQHPLFKSLFPEDVMQHIKGADGQLMWFCPYVNVYSYIEKGFEVISHPWHRPIDVRLVRKVE